MSVKAIKALIRKGQNFLLIKKSDLVDIYPGQWDLPGGRLEPGESWEVGLNREVKEETGLEIQLLSEIRNWESTKWNTIGKTVLCQFVSGEVRLSWEHKEYRWFSLEEIMKGDFPEWILKDATSAEQFLNRN